MKKNLITLAAIALLATSMSFGAEKSTKNNTQPANTKQESTKKNRQQKQQKENVEQTTEVLGIWG